MPEPRTNEPVKITAEVRPHPAIRKLARACIALAMQQKAADRQPTQSEGGDDQTKEADNA